MVKFVTSLGKVDKQASNTHTHTPSLFATLLCLAMVLAGRAKLAVWFACVGRLGWLGWLGWLNWLRWLARLGELGWLI